MFAWLVRILNREKAPLRPLDLRGFSMTRAEAAGWMDAVDPWEPDDSHPTRGDVLRCAERDELLLWARVNRGRGLKSRVICALYLAAARGPDFRTEAP